MFDLLFIRVGQKSRSSTGSSKFQSFDSFLRDIIYGRHQWERKIFLNQSNKILMIPDYFGIKNHKNMKGNHKIHKLFTWSFFTSHPRSVKNIYSLEKRAPWKFYKCCNEFQFRVFKYFMRRRKFLMHFNFSSDFKLNFHLSFIRVGIWNEMLIVDLVFLGQHSMANVGIGMLILRLHLGIFFMNSAI